MKTQRNYEMSTEFKLYKFRQRDLERTAKQERLARELRSDRSRERTTRQERWRWLSRLAALFA
jgi:hypothetical protein